MSDNSSSLKLESLYKEFDLNMIKYDQEYKNYMNILNANSGKFVILQGQTFWGSSGLSEGSANTTNQCQAMCSSNPKCTGATFKANSKYCWTRTGDGQIFASSSTNDYAIVTEIYKSASTLYSLNLNILSIVNQIKTIYRQNQDLYESILQKKGSKGNELNSKYNVLVEQNKEIRKILQHYQSVEENGIDTNLKVRQHSLHYKIYFFFFILISYISICIFFGIPFTFLTILYLAIVLFTYILNLTIVSLILFIIFCFYLIFS
jgi:hypothetical protein